MFFSTRTELEICLRLLTVYLKTASTTRCTCTNKTFVSSHPPPALLSVPGPDEPSAKQALPSRVQIHCVTPADSANRRDDATELPPVDGCLSSK